MKARIKWVEDRTFIGEAGSGHKIVLGTAFGPEGRTPGPSPMELVLIGLGGCSGYDVVHILEKGREAIGDVTVELEAERAQQDPKVFSRIHMHFVVKGRGLAAGKVERAIALSGYLRGVNPFDQPGVEFYKKNMFQLLNKPGYEKGSS